MQLAAATAAKSLQLCPTLCDPIGGSPPGSSIHGIFQARVLEWGATAFSEYSPLLVFYSFFPSSSSASSQSCSPPNEALSFQNINYHCPATAGFVGFYFYKQAHFSIAHYIEAPIEN